MLIQKGGCVYILTTIDNTALYIGVTSELQYRIRDHMDKVHQNSFTAKYNCTKLVWFEIFAQISEAIDREKQLKAGSRAKKIKLIEALNPDWKDLWKEDVQYW